MGDMVVTDTVDTTVERDLLMPKPKPNQKLKLSHGTDMDTPDSHTLMVDTDTHMVMDVVMDMVVTDTVDTVERDPLSHTTDMVDTDHTEDTDMAVMAMAMVVKS